MTRTLIIVAGCVLGGLSACTDINSRSTIGAQRVVPALSPSKTLASETTPVTRLDRSDWAPIEYRLPVDGVVHAPLWRTESSFDDDPHRQHGLYPTAESSLDLGGDPGEQAWHGVIEPLVALADFFVLPVRMVIDPAWDLEQSPRLYKRWRPGEWLAGPLPDTTPGAEAEPATPAADAPRSDG